MWKPTKAGVYLLDRSLVCITQPGCSAIEMVACNSTTVINKTLAPYGIGADMVGNKWSLLAPEWQDGAPTVEQLGRWQWWCIDFGYGQWVCQVEESESDGHVFAFGAVIDRQSVRRSAPVQPVPGEVLWVPMEVCK